MWSNMRRGLGKQKLAKWWDMIHPSFASFRWTLYSASCIHQIPEFFDVSGSFWPEKHYSTMPLLDTFGTFNIARIQELIQSRKSKWFKMFSSWGDHPPLCWLSSKSSSLKEPKWLEAAVPDQRKRWQRHWRLQRPSKLPNDQCKGGNLKLQRWELARKNYLISLITTVVQCRPKSQSNIPHLCAIQNIEKSSDYIKIR